MKNKIKILLSSIIFIILFLFFSGYIQEKHVNLSQEEEVWLENNRRTLNIVADPNVEPLEYFENGEYKGLASDFLNLIKEKLNVKIVVEKPKNWNDAFLRVKNGEKAILPIIAITEERKKDFLFTDKYFDLKVIVLSKNDNNLKDLVNKKIVLIKGYGFNKLVEKKYGENNEFYYEDSISLALKRLSLGEVDAFIIDSLTASVYIRKEKIANLKIMFELPEVYQLGMAVNKDYPLLRDILNKSLRALSQKEKNLVYDKWISYGNDNFWRRYRMIFIVMLIILFIVLLWSLALYFAVRSKTKELIITSNVFENSSEGILIADHKGNIIKVNISFEKMTGYKESDLIGKNPRIIKSDKHEDSFYAKMWQDLLELGEWKGEIWNRRKNGEVYPVWLLINVIKNGKGEIKNYVSIAQDLTVFKENQENINWLSNHDIVTGLPNQTLFRDRVKFEREEIKGTKKKFAILYIDIDNFKLINDAFGYAKGDQLLSDIAERIKEVLKPKCILSRISGDEFGILMTDLENAIELENMAKIILETFKKPFTIDGTEILITASLGLAVYPDDILEGESIINASHVALKHAKTLGKNIYSFYSKSLNREPSKRLKMDYELRNAISKNELYINYQPQIDIKNGEVIGIEALLRWKNAELGFVSPGTFIPLAEDNGMIIPIGKWMVKKACSDMKLLHELGFNRVNLSVNLSVIELKQSDFIENIAEILKETEFNPRFLEFEITEGFLLENEKENREKLEKIKEAGIKISIDDFGTGFSSLGYLKKFEFDKLKIDQSFIRNMPNKEDESISKTIIQLAQNLKLKVIAEGVETKEQYEFLKENECDEIQGYYFSKPLSYSELINYLLKQHNIR